MVENGEESGPDPAGDTIDNPDFCSDAAVPVNETLLLVSAPPLVLIIIPLLFSWIVLGMDCNPGDHMASEPAADEAEFGPWLLTAE